MNQQSSHIVFYYENYSSFEKKFQRRIKSYWHLTTKSFVHDSELFYNKILHRVHSMKKKKTKSH